MSVTSGDCMTGATATSRPRLSQPHQRLRRARESAQRVRTRATCGQNCRWHRNDHADWQDGHPLQVERMASLLGAIAEASTAAVAADPLQVERMVSLLGVVPRWQLAAVYRFQTRRRRPAAS